MYSSGTSFVDQMRHESRVGIEKILSRGISESTFCDMSAVQEKRSNMRDRSLMIGSVWITSPVVKSNRSGVLPQAVSRTPPSQALFLRCSLLLLPLLLPPHDYRLYLYLYLLCSLPSSGIQSTHREGGMAGRAHGPSPTGPLRSGGWGAAIGWLF